MSPAFWKHKETNYNETSLSGEAKRHPSSLKEKRQLFNECGSFPVKTQKTPIRKGRFLYI